MDTYLGGVEPKRVSKTFHVTEQEQIEVMGEATDAWRVEDRAANWTYWVRQEKPYIVPVAHPMPDGRMATSTLTRFD